MSDLHAALTAAIEGHRGPVMTTVPPRWSANTRGLVAMTAARHAVTRGIGFNCGWEPNPAEPTGAGHVKSEWLQWAAHNADAILTALAAEGLLVEVSR